VDDRVWKNLSIGLGVICAILIGVAGALLIVGHRGGSPDTSTPPGSAEASPTQAVESAVPSASVAGNPSPSAPPVQAASMATIVFNGLTLDSENDKTATVRTFTFASFGSDPLNIAVTKNSPNGSTRLCISVDASKPTCSVGSLPKFTKAQGDAGTQNNWKVTVVGYAKSKPTIDLTLSWPTAAPKIMLTHGRLQGSPSAEGLNGFTATLKPRAGGSLNVQASWTTVTADVDMSLSDVTSTPAVKLDDRQFKAAAYLNPAYTYNVDSTKTYLIKLRDLSPDSGRPDLTAQISFP
jgi:hypothetical protein